MRKILLFFVLLVSGYHLEAQQVALVLSGGGAKGLSHVGVLKALEENEIPIDYIVGNSMGAIIGGLYASGYSPSEIETLVKSVDFKQWVTGKIDERFFNYRLEEANSAWISVPFSIEKRLISRLPSSLISPYLMDYAVMELFSSASAASDYNFDKLFVPFRCVASDIDSSTLVVLDKGQLGIAIRASATFPLLIKPLVVDERLLFDGGMFNNFPTEIARSEFNPDIIIGSVAAGNYNPPKDNDIISQLQNMLMRKADLTLSEEEGVLIRSRIGPVGLLDFDRVEMYIDSGYQATINKLPEIKSIINRRTDTIVIKQRRTSYRERLPDLKFDTIIVKGVKPSQSVYINRKLNFNKKYSDLQGLKSTYFDLLADDKISYINPQLVFDSSRQQFNLVLDVTLSKPFLAEVGGNISSSATNQAFVGLTYRKLSRIGSRYGVNAYFGRFYSSVQGEVRYDLPGAQPIFGLVRAQLARKDYFKNATYFFEDPTPAFIIENESGIAIEMGHNLGSKTKAAIGMAGGRRSFDYYQTNNFGRNDTADISQLDFIKPQVGIYYNSLNK
ncbi:MAG TPA: patatin-like phospholipase family protein, partial [Bacteroidales bacterium]|nr:patatin-like phospholipase family protein [Bacteroidales bacterium]